MMEFTEYINPGLLVLVPALYIVGVIIKHTEQIADRFIPAILGATGIAFAVLWVIGTQDITGGQEAAQAIFTALVQGILCAGAAVYANQLIKQTKEDK